MEILCICCFCGIFELALFTLSCDIDNHYQLEGLMGSVINNFRSGKRNADNHVVRHYLDDYFDNLDMGTNTDLSSVGELSVQSITDKCDSFLRAV